MDLAMDPHYVGGRIGVLAVLHTWTRAMLYHPHLHCIVPAGGLDPEKDRWTPSRDKYLVPVRALSSLFRTRFMTLAKKRLPEIGLPKSVWDKNWVVNAKPAVQGADRVPDYLGRYVHRVAITNARILDSTEDRIRIRYLDRRKGQHRCASLQPDEFIRRFLQHVLPRGFHKVRSYGLLSPRYRANLKQLQQEFGEPEVNEEKSLDADIPQPFIPPDFGICPVCPACKKGLLKPLYWVPPRKRAPPQWI
ncbi:transposase [Breoghania sp.]|uniref:IS91 family transposase n=1 Tax=Breoghania sp. TaxID=2065378 RepID=UPI0029C9EF5C|nr:transposase [Breoghania sp.]